LTSTAAAFELTIRSPTALTTQHPENIWVTGGLATIVTRTVAVGIRIGIPTETVTVAAAMIGIEIEIGTLMVVTVVTGATDAARRHMGVADGIRPTIDAAGATLEARPAEAAPLKVQDGTMILWQELLRLMHLGGESSWLSTHG